MNRITLAYKNAKNALYDFLFPKGLQWYRLPNKRYKNWRTPSPGNEPINHEFNRIDYKTAYRDSNYNVRYYNDIKKTLDVNVLALDPLGDTPVKKLVRYGYLNENQKDDQQAIENATKQYEDEQGQSLSQTVHQDDFGFNERPIEKNNRESIAQYIRQAFTSNKELQSQEAYYEKLKDIYNPKFLIYNTWDMAADDPVWRQLKLDIEYYIEENTEKRIQLGFMPVFKGDPNFWQILDNSFSTENIRLVQSNARDTLTTLDPEALERNHNKIHLHKYEKLEFPLQNQTY